MPLGKSKSMLSCRLRQDRPISGNSVWRNGQSRWLVFTGLSEQCRKITTLPKSERIIVSYSRVSRERPEVSARLQSGHGGSCTGGGGRYVEAG